jgi:hypothetical protein
MSHDGTLFRCNDIDELVARVKGLFMVGFGGLRDETHGGDNAFELEWMYGASSQVSCVRLLTRHKVL